MKQNKSPIFSLSLDRFGADDSVSRAESGLSSTSFSCSSLNRALNDRWSVVEIVDVVSFFVFASQESVGLSFILKKCVAKVTVY